MNHASASLLLDGLLDCALSAAERDAVATHLAECAICRRQLAAAAHARSIVRGRLEATTAAPPELAERIRRQLAVHARSTAAHPAAPAERGTGDVPVAQQEARETSRWRWLRRPLPAYHAIGGAIAVGLLTVAAGGWWLTAATARRAAVETVVGLSTQHHLFARDDKAMEVEGEADAVAAWLRAHVPFPVVAPALPNYDVEGGRLVAVEGRLAAQVIYEEEATGRYVSLVIGPASATVPDGLRPLGKYRVGGDRDLSVAMWREAGVRMAIVGPLPESVLVALADRLVFPVGWRDVAPVERAPERGKEAAPRRE